MRRVNGVMRNMATYISYKLIQVKGLYMSTIQGIYTIGDNLRLMRICQ